MWDCVNGVMCGVCVMWCVFMSCVCECEVRACVWCVCVVWCVCGVCLL